MIYEINIATANNNEKLQKELNHRLRWIKQRGYQLDLHIYACDASNTGILTLKLYGHNSKDNTFRNEDIMYIFKHQISEVLAEHIVEEWEAKLVWKEIFRTYKKSTSEDKQIIYLKSGDFLRRCHENESINMLMNFGRKNRIAHKIMEHLNWDDMIIIEGFITFRLRDYLTEIKFAVEVAAEELRHEKEYNDFVNLLRYFVNSQIPRVFEVNLLIGPGGIFHIWDEDGSQIEEQYMQHYLDELLMDEISLDDILVSILITIAPRKIIIHNADDLPRSESLDIIKNVFEDKVVFCSNCKQCCQHLRELRKQQRH